MKMITQKVSDLSGAALDWAVAKAQGRTEIHIFGKTRPSDRGWVDVRFNPEPKAATARFDPSENWDYGGPIIERYGISFREYFNLTSPSHGTFYARICRESGRMVAWGKKSGHQQTGPTPLIAAMRCFVASKLGDEIEIPEVLRNG